MICDLAGFQRYSHFEYLEMPGGDQATKNPWRMAVSYLYKTFGSEVMELGLPFYRQISDDDMKLILSSIELNINAPLTSSAGRLFDAVAAITGVCTHSTFHAEAPMRLESFIDKTVEEMYGYEIKETISFRQTIAEIVRDIRDGKSHPIISAKFHNTIINIIFASAERIRKDAGINKVVLSGGTFQNRYILSRTERMLFEKGFEVYSQKSIPSNDAGIALGQLAIASKKRSLGLI